MNNLDNTPTHGWLSWFLKGLLFFVAIILFARLAELQIIKGDYYKNLSENNRIRVIPILAPRGQIKGSDGQILVGNVDIKEKVIFTKDGYEKSLDIANASPNDLITEPKRNYFLGDKAAHITGYLGEVNSEEVNKVDPNCPEKGPRRLGSAMGRGGLEEQYECQLRGFDGEELIEVDAMGKPVRILGIKHPIPGDDLTTTINTNLQVKVANSLTKPGVVLVTKPTGEVLAFYSSPSFNPNFFINKNATEIQNLITDKSLPLFNRPINGLYHPGSTFKIVTAVAALEENKIDENFTYTDQGAIKIGDFTYNNWYFTQYGRTEGEINLQKALARSTDTFFYKVGEMVGVDDLASWADKFGLNQKTGIDLPGEAVGLIPTPAWKRQAKGELWFLGNTYHMAIGQGDVAISPIAVNMITSVIANNGKLCKPFLNLALSKADGCHTLNLHSQTLKLIKEGMLGACAEGGTAYPFFDFKPPVACKTGTAETGVKDETHAWFSAFTADTVITVLVEKGGEGSKVAAPIAREIFNYYFKK